MMTWQSLHRARRGFSVLEMLVSLAIFMLVLIAIYSMFESSFGTYSQGESKSDIQQNTRGAMDLMVRNIRLAGYFPENFPVFILPAGPGTGCPGPPWTAISNATATQITVCGDVDGDNSGELITYRWVGDTNGDNIVDPGENEIRRQVTELVAAGALPEEVVAINVSAFQLSYFNAANTLINPVPGACAANVAPPCDIRRVVISMTGAEPLRQSAAIGGKTHNPFAQRPPDFQLVTGVRPRNLW